MQTTYEYLWWVFDKMQGTLRYTDNEQPSSPFPTRQRGSKQSRAKRTRRVLHISSMHECHLEHNVQFEGMSTVVINTKKPREKTPPPLRPPASGAHPTFASYALRLTAGSRAEAQLWVTALRRAREEFEEQTARPYVVKVQRLWRSQRWRRLQEGTPVDQSWSITSSIDPRDLVGRWVHVESVGYGFVRNFQPKQPIAVFAHSYHEIDFSASSAEGTTEPVHMLLGRMKLCRWNNGHRFSLCSQTEIAAFLAASSRRRWLGSPAAAATSPEKKPHNP